MATYSLTISMSAADVKKVAGAGQRITLVRTVGTFVAGDNQRYLPPTAVAWLALPPATRTDLAWDDQYDGYLTTCEPAPNQAIQQNAWTSMQPGFCYRLAQGYFHQEPCLPSSVGGYWIQNGTPDAQLFRFGLAQRYWLNQNRSETASPLNAVPLLYNQQARFDPQYELFVFLSSAAGHGYEIPPVTWLYPFTIGPNQRIALVFDGVNNTFYQAEADT